MTQHQKLLLRQSEAKAKLNDLLDLDVEQRSETYESEIKRVSAELRSMETEIQAALLVETPTQTHHQSTGEGRELRSMLHGANIGSIFEAAMERRSVDGVEAELQKHFGIGQNQIPLVLLETRAVTPAPTDVGATQQPIIPIVFPQSATAFLGVDSVAVPSGDAVFPVLTAGASAQTPAKDVATNPTEDTGQFSSSVLTASRLQTSFLYNREDAARFAGLDSALRQNLADALADGLDEEVISGGQGLLHGTNLPHHNVTDVTTYELYREQLAYGRVDGKYASETGDLRIVVGAKTYAHAAAQYRGNNDNQDALMSLREAVGGLRVSSHVPAVVSNKQNAVIRLGLRRDMIVALWEGITLVPDEITKASEGQIRITAILMHAVKVLRADGFYKQQTQHA